MLTIIPAGRPSQAMSPTQDPTTFTSGIIQEAHTLTHLCVTLPVPFATDALAAAIYSINSKGAGATRYLGFVSNVCPSMIVAPGWSEELRSCEEKGVVVQAKIVDQSLIPQLASQTVNTHLQVEWAKKIALNLYRFLESFNNGAGTIDSPTLQRALDRWLEKFSRRVLEDVEFVFRTD